MQMAKSMSIETYTKYSALQDFQCDDVNQNFVLR